MMTAARALEQAKQATKDAQAARYAGDMAAVEAADKRMKDAQRRVASLASWARQTQARGRLESMVALPDPRDR